MGYEWDFSVVFKNMDLLYLGFLGTLKIGFLSLGLAAALGLVLALLRMSGRRWLSVSITVYIEFFRIMPVIALLFWVYYALPIATGLRIDAFTAAVLTLTVQSSAFFAEVYRAGIESIEKSQWEGGKSIGMTSAQLMRRIILPQAVRRMIPPFTERSFELMKGTTIAATIAYGDLLYSALVLSSQLYRPLEIISLVALFYLGMLTLASFFLRRLERRLDAAML